VAEGGVTTYRGVVKPDEDVLAFLLRHKERIGETPPLGLFVAERAQGVVAALLVWTEPFLHVSVIVEGVSVFVLTKLARLFERWAAGRGATRYAFCVPSDDYAYRRIVEHRGAIRGAVEDRFVWYVQPIHLAGEHTRERPGPEPDTFRRWEAADERSVTPLVRAFLEEHYAAGGDYPPTDKNVAALFRRGVKAGDEGDPALLAIRDGRPVGFVLWCRVPPVDLDLRESICCGVGTYIDPAYRRKGLASALRLVATDVARHQGYTRVDGVALDARGLAAGRAVGGQPSGTFMRLPIRTVTPTEPSTTETPEQVE